MIASECENANWENAHIKNSLYASRPESLKQSNIDFSPLLQKKNQNQPIHIRRVVKVPSIRQIVYIFSCSNLDNMAYRFWFVLTYQNRIHLFTQCARCWRGKKIACLLVRHPIIPYRLELYKFNFEHKSMNIYEDLVTEKWANTWNVCTRHSIGKYMMSIFRHSCVFCNRCSAQPKWVEKIRFFFILFGCLYARVGVFDILIGFVG